MPVMRTVWRQVYTAIATARWSVLLGTALAHMILCWMLMSFLGEKDLSSSFTTWFYYYTVTATTVGYGDLSPATDAGRIAGSIFVIPVAIAIFTAIIGKGVSDIGSYWKGRLMGQGNYTNKKDHVIVIGWQGERTRRLIEGMILDNPNGEQPLLVSSVISENPMPRQIDFVAVETLSDVRGLSRAGCANAKVIVIRGQNDDETLAATLAAQANATTAHIVAHFEEEAAANLIKKTNPNIETAVSVSTDIIVRAACDPGTSTLSRLMFSANTKDTAYSLEIPEEAQSAQYIDLLIALKRKYEVNLVGVRSAGKSEPDLNCSSSKIVSPGDSIYYIADQRLINVNWATIHIKDAA